MADPNKSEVWQRASRATPEPPLPLHPQVSCDLLTRNGRRSTKSRTSSLPSPHHSLAVNIFLRTVELSKHVCISVQSLVITKLTKSREPSQPYAMISKTSAQHMARRLDFSTTRSVSQSETQGRPSVLPGTPYLDTTPLPHPR
jgi:hypothetical protein